MSDRDLIRKAVELADGWFMQSNGSVFCPAVPEKCYPLSGTGPMADLLAAQLVRQVDAALPRYGVCVFDDETVVECRPAHVCVSGPHRTMNTIKAIVDSEVLVQ